VTLQRSWANPAPVKLVEGSGFLSAGYDPAQKAYVIQRMSDQADAATIEIGASMKSPLVNPALVLKNWGDRSATIAADGSVLPRGPDCRLGWTRTLEAIDLVVWLRRESTLPVTIQIAPGGDRH
jgi:hypothetical protein